MPRVGIRAQHRQVGLGERKGLGVMGLPADQNETAIPTTCQQRDVVTRVLIQSGRLGTMSGRACGGGEKMKKA